MPVKKVLLLGNPKLYEISTPVKEEELESLRPILQDLHDTMVDSHRKHGVGRAIAAPQIGVMKRLIYMNINEPVIFINPKIDFIGKEMIEVWEACMCFPDLLINAMRPKKCRITYRDTTWREQTMYLEDDLSALLQHNIDHLNGILKLIQNLSHSETKDIF